MALKPVDTAVTLIVGPLVDDTDFKTLETAIAYNAAGMDVDLIVEKTDGTTVKTDISLTTAGSNDWTHRGNGYYEVEITAAQNAEEGIAHLVGHCTGVLPFRSPAYDVVPTVIYDSLVKGTDKLQTDTVQWLGTACAAPTVAGVPEVDMTHLGGSTQSATDLKDFADAGYSPATHKVAGVVLADTVTTYTGNTPQTGDAYAVVNDADHGNAKLVRSTTPANTLDVSATGEAGLDFNNIKNALAPHTLTNITVPWSASWDTEVQSECNDALVALNLDHWMKTAVGNNADMTTEVPDGTVLSNMLSKTSDTSTYVVADDSLQGISEGAAGGGLDAQETRDAMKLAPTAGAPAAGSVDKHLDDASTHDAAAVKTAVEAAGSHLALILADTGTDGVKVAAGAITVLQIAANAITADKIAANAITAAKFDESTAYPLKAADTGATQVARVGADGDTLETLSDQIDVVGAGGSTYNIVVEDRDITVE